MFPTTLINDNKQMCFPCIWPIKSDKNWKEQQDYIFHYGIEWGSDKKKQHALLYLSLIELHFSWSVPFFPTTFTIICIFPFISISIDRHEPFFFITKTVILMWCVYRYLMLTVLWIVNYELDIRQASPSMPRAPYPILRFNHIDR